MDEFKFTLTEIDKMPIKERETWNYMRKLREQRRTADKLLQEALNNMR